VPVHTLTQRLAHLQLCVHLLGCVRVCCRALRRHCQQAIVQLADALGWGVMVLHDAKGMFPEGHPSFIGTYSPFYTSPTSVKHCYEAADAILFIGKGPTWNCRCNPACRSAPAHAACVYNTALWRLLNWFVEVVLCLCMGTRAVKLQQGVLCCTHPAVLHCAVP
jgi:hypothetical protein